MKEISDCFIKIAEALEKEQEKNEFVILEVDRSLVALYNAAKYLKVKSEVLDKIRGWREEEPRLAKGYYYTFSSPGEE